MSTKVYAGIVIDFADQLWERIEEIRSVCEATFEELNDDLTQKKIFDEYKKFVVSHCLNKDNYAISSGLYLNALQTFKEDKKDWGKDELKCNVLVRPETTDNGNIGYVMGNEEYYTNLIEQLDYVSDYSYWNNTDKPDNLSETEWDKRRKNWNKIFDKDILVGSSGFSILLPMTEERTFKAISADTIIQIDEPELRKISHALILDSIDFKYNKSDYHKVIDAIFKISDILEETSTEDLPLKGRVDLDSSALIADNINEIKLPEFNRNNLNNILDKICKKVTDQDSNEQIYIFE